ncbi:MAG: hypothetical protein AB1898_13410 [Acidobacteriota bacterium]
MKLLKRFSVGVAVVLLALVVGLAIAWMVTAPQPPPAGSESASRLRVGPHTVGRQEFKWVDGSRPTPRNKEFPGAPERALPATLWFPQGFQGPLPLLVFSHGLMSSRLGCTYLAEHLASYGYAVLSADFPLTKLEAPGGPNHLDVVHQPADISFLIDRVLALDGAVRPFEGRIDQERIGVFGISLGGATATLVAFHPEWRDGRVGAAVSIGGPGDIFGPRFFEHAAIPFLMIAGTSDAIVDYNINASPIPQRLHQGGLLSIEGGTHAGFTHVTAGLLRVLGNPDNIGCGQAKPGDIPQNESVFVGLFGTADQGLLVPPQYRPPCAQIYQNTMRAGRQQMIATLAVQAFFGSYFAKTEEERRAHYRYLTLTLPNELPEVRYTPGRRAAPET